MLNLEPIKEIMHGNIGKILFVGAILIIGNLLSIKGKTARRHAIIRANHQPWRAWVVVGLWKGSVMKIKSRIFFATVFFLMGYAPHVLAQYAIILEDGTSYETKYHWKDGDNICFWHDGKEKCITQSTGKNILQEKHETVPITGTKKEIRSHEPPKKRIDPSGTGIATTSDKCVSCLKEEWLDDLITFIAANDRGSVDSYIKTNKCFILKPGVTVAIMKHPGMIGGKAQFVYEGVKFWTTREGLTNYR